MVIMLWDTANLASSDAVNLTRKDVPKPSKNFKADCEKLCETFQVPMHPCLARNSAGENGSVEFRNHRVDPCTMKIVLHVLKSCDSISQLRFLNTGLSAGDISTMAAALPQTSITKLSLDFNPVAMDDEEEQQSQQGIDAAGAITTASPFLPLVSASSGLMLSQLSLRGCGIDDMGIAQFCECLEQNTSLKGLNLFGNAIGDAGAAALTQLLKVNTQLSCLSLADNRVETAGMDAFQELLNGYEVAEDLMAKRDVSEKLIAASNKSITDAAKKKKETPQLIPDLPSMEERENGRLRTDILKYLSDPSCSPSSLLPQKHCKKSIALAQLKPCCPCHSSHVFYSPAICYPFHSSRAFASWFAGGNTSLKVLALSGNTIGCQAIEQLLCFLCEKAAIAEDDTPGLEALYLQRCGADSTPEIREMLGRVEVRVVL
ncbi:unnamed protein product [Chrysoparadoxa australica]